ncbi:membrane protein insertase YidC [Buchnera aphidicola (Ceratovacuna keduensis)]|uniref:membrane protein insertase YidC n=1 Tax=Buchnera aphidicola TaxID=9 RepID=UPI0031B86C7D
MYWIKNIFILVFLFILGFFVYKFNNTNFFHNSFYKEKHNNINLEKSSNTFNNKDIVMVKTDTFKILIDKSSGNIVEANLLKYKKNVNKPDPLCLLKSKNNFLYQANSGILGLEKYNFYYDNEYNKKNIFELSKNENNLLINMKWKSNDGISYIKTFSFERGKHFVKIKYNIINDSNKNLDISMYGNLNQSINIEKENKNYGFGMKTFRGAAYSNSKKKYSKINFDDIENKNYISDYSNKNKWIAMVQPYFVSAWIPDNSLKNKMFVDKINVRDVSVGYITEKFKINSYQNKFFFSKLWLGPKVKKEMLEVSDSLYFTIDYGFLWFLSQPLFKLLYYLHSFLKNWGISIIAITCIIKLIMYPISKFQYYQIAKMKEIQSEINIIKKRHKNNKNMLNKEIIDLYKKNNINPIGSFLPLIIQMPIFLSLYYVIIESVELRHSPFILWINDLSDKDPFFILPILMGITTFLLQNDSKNDDNNENFQKKIINIMPVFFTIFFLWFPSGLVLYYIVSNILTIIQQKIVYNKFKI